MSSHRIAVVGTCQVVGVAATLRAVLPGSTVKAWHIGEGPQSSPEEISLAIQDFDIVFTQLHDTAPSSQDALKVSELAKKGQSAAFFPNFVFRGFQPDCIYLHSPAGLIKDGLGDKSEPEHRRRYRRMDQPPWLIHAHHKPPEDLRSDPNSGFACQKRRVDFIRGFNAGRH
jgi:hypothetical protein